MKLHTVSGLHGDLIEFVSTAIDHGREGFDGLAIVKHDHPVYANRPYSTHRLGTIPDGKGGFHQVADAGHYDLTLSEAQADLQHRRGKAERSSRTYVLHYASADGPGPGATWSVYREQYASVADDEPIDGTQEWVSQHATEAEAYAEARRLQMEES